MEVEMSDFQIKDQFYLDEKPLKILSGAIHYFRVHPDDQYYSLFNPKALGFNTVETYVPWNLHESKKEHFFFNFGDGWGANVEVKYTTSGEAKKIIKKSKGFCGYEWMCYEIMQNGRIKEINER